MKAVVLAAGKGERLKGVVDTAPKPMVKVDGKPILEHNIAWLKSFGITDICINIHYLPDVVTNYFGDGSKWGVKIIYSYEPKLLGTAGAVRKIVSEIWKDSVSGAFVVAYGDNLLSDFDLRRIIDFHFENKGLSVLQRRCLPKWCCNA
jgi:NDP-sugar pyrophosphorylase family protein